MKHLESQIIVPIRRKKPGYVKPSNYHCVCVCVRAQSNISTNCPQAKYPRTVHLDRRWMSSVVSLSLSLFLCFSVSLFLYFSISVFLSLSLSLYFTQTHTRVPIFCVAVWLFGSRFRTFTQSANTITEDKGGGATART